MIAPVGQLADWIKRFLADPDIRPFEAGVSATRELRNGSESLMHGFAVSQPPRRDSGGRRKHDARKRVPADEMASGSQHSIIARPEPAPPAKA
jgi:hypothetical protein